MAVPIDSQAWSSPTVMRGNSYRCDSFRAGENLETRVNQARARWSLAWVANNRTVNLLDQFQKLITLGQQFEGLNPCEFQIANSISTAGDYLAVRKRSSQFQMFIPF